MSGGDGSDKVSQLEALKLDLELARTKDALDAVGSESAKKLRELAVQEEAAKLEASIRGLRATANDEIEQLQREEAAERLRLSSRTLRDTPDRQRTEHRASLAAVGKAVTPILVTVAASMTAYCTVNRHAQIVSDRELNMKQVELDRSFRTQVIKEYLALPDNTSLSRRDMLAFIAATHPAADPIHGWAVATKKELEERVKAIEDNQAKYYRPGAPGAPSIPAYHCFVTINRPNTTSKTAEITRPASTSRQEGERACRAFADSTCAEEKLDPKHCTERFEIIYIPSGKVQIPGTVASPGASTAAPAGSAEPPPFQAVITAALANEGLRGSYCVVTDEQFLAKCAVATEDECKASLNNRPRRCIAKPKTASCFAFDRTAPHANCFLDTPACEAARSVFPRGDLKQFSAKCETVTL